MKCWCILLYDFDMETKWSECWQEKLLKKYGMTRKLKCRRQEKNDEKAGCLLTKKPEFDIEKLFITERNAQGEKEQGKPDFPTGPISD